MLDDQQSSQEGKSPLSTPHSVGLGISQSGDSFASTGKHKNITSIVVAGVIIIGGGVLFFSNSSTETPKTDVKTEAATPATAPAADSSANKPAELGVITTQSANKVAEEQAAKQRSEQYLAQIKELEASLESAKQKKDYNEISTIAVKMITLHEKNYHYDKAVALLQYMVDLNTEKGYHGQAAESYNKIGYLYLMERAFDRAIPFYLKAVEANKKANNPANMAFSYHNLGQAYLLNADYPNAAKNFEEALNIHSENHNERNMIDALNALSLTFKAGKKPNEALAYQVASLELSIKNKWDDNIIRNYLEIGNLYSDINDKEQACRSYSEALSMAAKPEFQPKFKGDLTAFVKEVEAQISAKGCSDAKDGGFKMQ